MTKIFSSLAVLALLCNNSILCQPTQSPYNLFPPLKGELNLSGAFGEIRTNNIHGGIDFRTGGKTGLPLYSSDDGFIARLRVNGLVYGKAIYIQHPNGLTTVYGHLDQFTPEIDSYVKEQQYKRESFEVDLYPSATDLPVKRGQLIGYSGNTGFSAGPHLHYEVRLTNSQTPLNPAFSNLKIIDTLSPIIFEARLYEFDLLHFTTINNSKKLNVQKIGKNFFVNQPVKVQGVVALGIETYDFVNANSLPTGIYSIKMYNNGKLCYHFCMDEYDFIDSRYANSHIDYAIRQTEGKRIHRIYKEPGNKLPVYRNIVNNGLIYTQPDSLYKIKIVVEDPYKNRCELNMTLNGVGFTSNQMTPIPFDTTQVNPYWLFFQDNSFSNQYFSINAPKNILYNSVYFSHNISAPKHGMYSSIIGVHDRKVPLHKAYSLKISVDSLPEHLQSKALVGSYGSKGEIIGVGGEYTNGTVDAQINYFGDFFVIVDTTAPAIVPLNIHNEKDLSKENIIKFKVIDDLSGIASIKGTIDGKWALYEHDPKNSLVFYQIDSKKVDKGQNHKLHLVVTDNKGNQSVFSCAFIW